MKNSLLLLMGFLVIVILAGSCSKSGTPQNPSHTEAVYAAGYYNKAGKSYTALWKDGMASIIDSNASPRDIYVNGADLYITGQKNSKGIFWKNGVSTQLNTAASYGYVMASSIYVNGSDVHIAGMAEDATTFSKHAIYWKNNVPTLLNAGANTENSYAQSVFVNGNDVYVAGYRTLLTGGMAVVVWKNGVATDLISSSTISYGNVQLYVWGNDVYVTCYEYDSPNWEQIRLWKNGTPVPFAAATLGAVPYCLFVNGADVYIGGFEREGTASNNYTVAKYWKNGVAVTAWSFTPGINIVHSIYVDGDDVYAGGVTGSATAASNPVMLKNGSAYPLTGAGTNPTGEILSVFVK